MAALANRHRVRQTGSELVLSSFAGKGPTATLVLPRQPG
jgi:hypothetical protein